MSLARSLSPTLMTAALTGLMDPDPTAAGGAGGGETSETADQKVAREATEAAAAAAAEAAKTDPLTIDINKAIEKARKQEKDKLYRQIEDAEKGRKTAEQLADSRATELKTATDKLAAMTKAPTKVDEPVATKTTALTEDAINKIVEATVDMTSKKFDETIAAAQGRIKELEDSLARKDIVALRQELLSKNAGYIVPELVTGNTPEELEQSLVIAKQVFARVIQGHKSLEGASGNEASPAGAARTFQLPPNPSVSSQGAPGATRTVDVSKLSDKDYKTNREVLLKAAADAGRKAILGG